MDFSNSLRFKHHILIENPLFSKIHKIKKIVFITEKLQALVDTLLFVCSTIFYEKNEKSNFIIELKSLNLYNEIESDILIQKGFDNMLGIDVKKTNEELIISWQLAKVQIPLSEIIEVTEDETYAGVEEENVIRIGTAYATTDRILIKTVKQNYLLFTTNRVAILNKINA